ncbi:hypothetical protein AALA22_14235 [Anaerovoracaceae bacterium 41-7]
MKKLRVILCAILVLTITIMPFSTFAAAKTIKRPVIMVENIDNNYLEVSWDKCSGATKYQVYRATKKTGTYKRIATTTKDYYEDTSVKNKTSYYYKVRAVGKNNKKSSFSKIKSGKVNFNGKISVDIDFPELPLGIGEVRMAYVTISGCDESVIAYYDPQYIDVVWNNGIDGEYPLEIWVEDCKPFPFETKIVFKFENHEQIYSKTLRFVIDGWA